MRITKMALSMFRYQRKSSDRMVMLNIVEETFILLFKYFSKKLRGFIDSTIKGIWSNGLINTFLFQTVSDRNCFNFQVHLSCKKLRDIFMSILPTPGGLQKCLNRGIKSCRETFKSVSSTQSIFNDTELPKVLLSIIGRRLAKTLRKLYQARPPSRDEFNINP